MGIKAIETAYKGYRFRSRLEARWAVFFDACGVEWLYESQGYELGNGLRYLPDFVLKNVRFGKEIVDSLYVEIKGRNMLEPVPESEAEKFNEFARQYASDNEVDSFGLPVTREFIILGDLSETNFEEVMKALKVAKDEIDTPPFGKDDNVWEQKYRGKTFPFRTYDAECGETCFPCIDKDGCLRLVTPTNYSEADVQRTNAALNEFKSARFEHGEKPEVKDTLSAYKREKQSLKVRNYMTAPLLKEMARVFCSYDCYIGKAAWEDYAAIRLLKDTMDMISNPSWSPEFSDLFQNEVVLGEKKFQKVKGKMDVFKGTIVTLASTNIVSSYKNVFEAFFQLAESGICKNSRRQDRWDKFFYSHLNKPKED